MGHKLLLNVYHLNPNNQFLYKIGLGFYHTGIEVNGMEYSFGGNPYASGTGVFMQPPNLDDPSFFIQIELGEFKDAREFERTVDRL